MIHTSAERVPQHVVRVVAPSPSPMTLDGTNTCVVGRGDLVVVDPGADILTHVEAILAAAGGLGIIRAGKVREHLSPSSRAMDG